MRHVPVLIKEVIDNLNIKKGDIIIDATVGDGGHSEEILKILREGMLIAIDFDSSALKSSRDRLKLLAKENNNKIIFIHNNFIFLKKILEEKKVSRVDSILADLGWRNDQLEKLSFKENRGLDMSLSDCEINKERTLQIINNEKEEELNRIFREFGQEQYSRMAVRAICEARKDKAIITNIELSQIINKAIGRYYKKKRIDPATKIFQALRIKVNEELLNLEGFLEQSIDILNRGGRLLIISYHSLEDRITKNFFRTNAGGCVCPKEFPVCVCGKKSSIKRVTRKPIVPEEEELKSNNRSRSAKMRIIQKK